MVAKDWKEARLKDISQKIQTGPFGSLLHASDYTSEGVSIIMPKDIINQKVKLNTATNISPEKAHELKKYKLESGDIVFSRRGDITSFALINNEQAICGTGCIQIRLNKNNSPFFMYFLLQLHKIKKSIIKSAIGQTMLHINPTILGEIPFKIPSLKEQEKIAEILSTWDRAIEVNEQLLANSQQQKVGFIQRLLHSEQKGTLLKPLNKVCLINPKNQKPRPSDKITFVAMPNVSTKAKVTGTRLIPYSEVPTGSSSFRDNDVIIAKITPCFENGKGFLAKSLKTEHGFGSTEFHILRARPGTSPDYIFHLTTSSTFRGRGKLNMQGSAGHKRVTTDFLKSFKIPVPPLAEQQRIARILNAADREIELLERKIAHLKQEKKALMQQLLTGKRRVKVEPAEA